MIRRRSPHKAVTANGVPEACVTRLSLYARELALLEIQGKGFVSSRWLAQQLGLTDAQVRRDLSYFGQFGVSGKGYNVRVLHGRLTGILGVSGRTWNLALAGIGNLGSALLAHKGFRERGFLFRIAVDTDPAKVGQTVEGLTVSAADRLTALVREHKVHIGVIAVPAAAAQNVCDHLLQGGVRSIMNFAPVRLETGTGARVRSVDLALEMESLAFHLARGEAAAHA